MNAFDVVGIVKRRQLYTILDSFHDGIADQGRILKHLTAVHHAMSDRIDVGSALDFCDARPVRSYISNYVFERRHCVAKRLRQRLCWLTAVADADDCRASNPLNFAAADAVIFVVADPLKIGRNDLELQRGASGVHHQHVHGFG